MIDTPWSYISSNGVVTGGQFNGTGAFGSMCSVCVMLIRIRENRINPIF